jgi:hypothetical protein
MNTKDIDAKVRAGEVREHHTSYIRQYVSRKRGAYVKQYAGRFGRGYVVLSPNWNSTWYSYITYYINVS